MEKIFINDRMVSLLYKRLVDDELTIEEIIEIQSWIGESADNQETYEEIMDPEILQKSMQEFYAPGKQLGLITLNNAISSNEKRRSWKKSWISIVKVFRL